MRHFDVIVIGAGSGLIVSSLAAQKGKKVAVIEEGPLGGTCLNRGCIPSKIVIHSADVAETIKRANSFGINVKGYSVNFSKITSNASKIVDKDSRDIESGLKATKNITLYKKHAAFIGDKMLKVGDEAISGSNVIIAAGTRPFVPPVEGLDKVDYLTSKQALRLKKQPKTLTILGGGYIAAEMAHFFGSLGTKVTIIQRNPLLIPNSDEEIAEKFTKIFRKKFNIMTEFEGKKVYKKNGKIVLEVVSKKGTKKKVISDQLLVAVGRVPNSDKLDISKCGIEANKRGYITTNEYLETSVPGVWALGDIAGKFLFKHSANFEAQHVAEAVVNGNRISLDYGDMPSAIFSSPQVASIGMTRQQLKEKNIDYIEGRYEYMQTGMGVAMQDKEGFAKLYVDKASRKILGCHIMGGQASTLIHEVIVVMRAGLTIDAIKKSIHIHPALSELIQRAANSIKT